MSDWWKILQESILLMRFTPVSTRSAYVGRFTFVLKSDQIVYLFFFFLLNQLDHAENCVDGSLSSFRSNMTNNSGYAPYMYKTKRSGKNEI